MLIETIRNLVFSPPHSKLRLKDDFNFFYFISSFNNLLRMPNTVIEFIEKFSLFQTSAVPEVLQLFAVPSKFLLQSFLSFFQSLLGWFLFNMTFLIFHQTNLRWLSFFDVLNAGSILSDMLRQSLNNFYASFTFCARSRSEDSSLRLSKYRKSVRDFFVDE